MTNHEPRATSHEPRVITVVTPENITLTYQAAGIASRFMAVVVDLLIQVLTAVIVAQGIHVVTGGGTHNSVGPASLVSAAGIIFVGILLPFAYAIFFEMLWDGRTPGKRLFGLRTVRDGGYPISLFSSVIRNVLRIIDFGLIPLASPLVLCGLPGLSCMFFSPANKRIGDYAAGTVVIVEGLRTGGSVLPAGAQTAGFHPSVEAVLPYVRNINRVSRNEYELVRRFTTRNRNFDLAVQAGVAERLARPLMEKLEMDFPIYYQIQYMDVLGAIERRWAEEHGVL